MKKMERGETYLGLIKSAINMANITATMKHDRDMLYAAVATAFSEYIAMEAIVLNEDVDVFCDEFFKEVRESSREMAAEFKKELEKHPDNKDKDSN